MSIFNNLLSRILEIQERCAINWQKEDEATVAALNNFLEDPDNCQGSAKDKLQRGKARTTTLQIINENGAEKNKSPDTAVPDTKSSENVENNAKRLSKKRSKEEVDGISSPEQDKRAKRKASVKAQNIISKQEERVILRTLNEEGIAFVSSTAVVNVSLNQKLRREDSMDKRPRRGKNDDKENAEPVPVIQIKQEKISLPPEPEDTALLPIDVQVKQEPIKDETAMPPPLAPVPKPRKAIQKPKTVAEESVAPEETSRRNTRNKKQEEAESMPPPAAPAPASTRESRTLSRTTKVADAENMPPPEPRPKRTRGRKKVSSSSETGSAAITSGDSAPASTRASRLLSRSSRITKAADAEEVPPPKPRPKRTRNNKKVSNSSETDTTALISGESAPASPADKPRPKRTRRGKNAPEKVPEKEEVPQPPPKDEEITETFTKDKASSKESPKEDEQSKLPRKEDDQSKVSPKKERISEPQSPVFSKPNKKGKNEKNNAPKAAQEKTAESAQTIDNTIAAKALDETRVLQPASNLNATVTISNDMDKTVVLPNGVYNHAPVTPHSLKVNETVVLETYSRETMVLEKRPADATVILDKRPINITDDNSLLTDDGSEPEFTPSTPPGPVPKAQPTSAVKEKVQKFEELAARTTRTKTRAQAKMQDEPQDTNTPPDKMIKPVLSQESLNKMNNMIFNGKPPQVSNSASKPRALPPTLKSQTASTSKLSALNKHREAAEREKEKEDARKKKEAMLEAKREQQKKKREEKMANAAAAREAAERDRRLALEAAARERWEKQQHADLEKLERLKEVEKKKQEQARKAAETEERRRAEKEARAQKLAEEQKKAELARKRQLEEMERMKKEAMLAKEIEQRKKEYMEKQKLKYIEKSNTPLRMAIANHYHLEPVYMADGFQYLNSDEDDDEPPKIPVPAWSTSKARRHGLAYQSRVPQTRVDALFSVQVHTPDLREIFPDIERARLKRTSSAVWRTPPKLPTLEE